MMLFYLYVFSLAKINTAKLLDKVLTFIRLFKAQERKGENLFLVEFPQAVTRKLTCIATPS